MQIRFIGETCNEYVPRATRYRTASRRRSRRASWLYHASLLRGTSGRVAYDVETYSIVPAPRLGFTAIHNAAFRGKVWV